MLHLDARTTARPQHPERIHLLPLADDDIRPPFTDATRGERKSVTLLRISRPASALAAGCPVIVKIHNAHPGTGMLVASAVTEAVAAHGLPEGVFSTLDVRRHARDCAVPAPHRVPERP